MQSLTSNKFVKFVCLVMSNDTANEVKDKGYELIREMVKLKFIIDPHRKHNTVLGKELTIDDLLLKLKKSRIEQLIKDLNLVERKINNRIIYEPENFAEYRPINHEERKYHL